MSTNTCKRQLANGISAFAVAAALLVATPAYAQSDTATLQGRVEGASAGTQVVATDNNTGRKVTGTVDATGNYTILGLTPGTYTITVEGRDAQQTTLLVGQTAVVDFVPPSTTGAEGGAVVVTGRRVREVRTATVSTNITPAQIENLPQNKRNFLSFAALAPGVQVTPGDNAQVQAGAIASQFTNVYLDGMSFKNPINHGGVFGQNFGLGNPFPQIAVQEYSVETQNFGAESGQAGSALITAITKTGGNEFHGSAFIEFQPKSFITQPHYDKKANRKKPDYNRKQYGAELGGPIIPGKLHFYVAAERTNQVRPTTTGTVDETLFPTSLTSQTNISKAMDFKQGLYFGKLTAYITDQDTVNLSGFLRREDNLSDIDGNALESHGRRINTDQDRFQLQWRHNAGDFLNQLNIAYDKGKQATPGVTSGIETVMLNDVNAPFSEGILGGAHFFTQGDKQKSWTIKNDSTLRMAEHTLKFGGTIAFLKLNRTEENAFNGRYYFFNPVAGGLQPPTAPFDFATAQPIQTRINLQTQPGLSAKDTQVGLYVQDEWRPDNHWTVNAGIRWDYESNANNNDYVTPANIAAALRAYPGWAARGIDPEDYISDGDNRDPFWGAFQPRLGVSYDVHGDRDLVFFGGAGRYYDRQLFIQGVLENLINQRQEVSLHFCPNGGAGQGLFPGDPLAGTGASPGQCAQWTEALRNPDNLRAFSAASAATQGLSGGAVWVLNNKSKMPYSDQFNLGVRKRFGQIQTALTFSHIRSHNIQMFARANFYSTGWFTRNLITTQVPDPANPGQTITVVTGCTDGGEQWIIDLTPGTNYAACAATNGQLTGFNGKLNRGLSNGKANYNAIYFTAEKPFTDQATWGFTTSLTLQRARSNVAMELNSDEHWNGPFFGTYGWNNVNGVPKWNWVTSANYRAPYGFILSGILTLNSGPSFGNIRFIPAPDGACCYGNMGGALWPKYDIGYKRLDLRVAKTFKTPWGHEVSADFEVFNAFNWLNRSYSAWTAGSGIDPPRTEKSQIGGDARAFQAGLRYKF